MRTPADVVRMEDIETHPFAAVQRHRRPGLGTEEAVRFLRRQNRIAREAVPLFHNGIPDGRRVGQILRPIVPNCQHHPRLTVFHPVQHTHPRAPDTRWGTIPWHHYTQPAWF